MGRASPRTVMAFWRSPKRWLAWVVRSYAGGPLLLLLLALPAMAGPHLNQSLRGDGEGAFRRTPSMRLGTTGMASTLDIRIAASADDGEERPNGSVFLGQRALDLVTENGIRQTVGLRFTQVGVAPGATVVNAYVQFQTRVATSTTTNLTVRGESSDNSNPFTATAFNVSSRRRTTATVHWSPPSWTVVGQEGVNQRTSDLTPVLQEIFNRRGWTSGNALALIITGTGRRVAEAFEGTQPPILHIDFMPTPQCSDGVDNDGDGQTDFPNDPGCTDAQDDDETDVQLARPNILVIMTDDQRASSDGLSVMDELWRIYGDRGTHYPNGVVTTALCCPSRASTFAGRYAHNTGVTDNNGNPLDQTTTLQYHLQQKLGYKTALTGKYLNDFTGTPPYFDLLALRTGYYDSTGTYGTSYIKNKAIEFLGIFEQNDAQPWLMYVHPFAPHPDSVPENKYKSAFVPAWKVNPAKTETDLSDKPPYVAKQASNTSKSGIQNLRARMIRTLYSVDDLIAAVFAELKALGETNTLTFFLSDNGYQWYEHQLSGKGHAYNHSHRVPFFVRWPGHLAAGAIDRKIVANIDIAPTVYDALGYQPDNYVPDGRSIFTSQRDMILTEGFGRGYKGLWNPDWMYAEYRDGFFEFYGSNDPWQLDNRFKTGSPPANAMELKSRLGDYENCVGSGCP